MEVPPAFDGFVEYHKRVSSTCLVTHERNRYSVPAVFANQPVSLRSYPEYIKVVVDSHTVASHKRVFCRDHRGGNTIYDWRHYLCVIQRKPGALRNGAPFHEMPDSFRQLQAIVIKRPGGDREMVDILSLVLLHDENMVAQAVTQALKIKETSKQHVMNCLSRILDAPKPEPVANTQRYDGLRGEQQ